MLGLSDNPIVIMLMINLLLLFVGTFMDMTPAVLIFTLSFSLLPKPWGLIRSTSELSGLPIFVSVYARHRWAPACFWVAGWEKRQLLE